MNRSHRRTSTFILALAGLAGTPLAPSAQAQPASTSFTYQGRLTSAGAAPTGAFDLRFRLFSAASGGTQIGTTICVDNVAVAAGLFTVQLDFGQQFATPQQRHLEIEVRADTGLNCTNVSGFTLLSTRQPITPAPLAAHANAAFALDAPDGSPANAVFVDNSGNVGVGTTSPQTSLHVVAPASGEGMRIQGPLSTPANQSYLSFNNSAGTAIGYVGDGSSGDNNVFVGAYNGDVTLVTVPGGRVLTATAAGNLSLGSSSGDYRHMRIGGGNSDGYLYGSFVRFADGIHMGYNYFADSGGVDRILHPDGGTSRVTMGYGFITMATAPAFGGAPVDRLTVDQAGNVTVQRDLSVRQLTIRGGADLAEPFDVAPGAADAAKPAPGMLVVIDPANPGALKIATQPYDTKVAGAISGANGLAPGMVMKAEGTDKADGEHPVAMTGRVWVWCDAASGAITPGDLLTSSSTPGHAMKATDPARSHGAVIGKAMTELKDGRGMVLVLVNLQ